MRGHEAPQAAALADGAPGSREGAGRSAVPGAVIPIPEFAQAARAARRNGNPGREPWKPVRVRG
jgi:hypothetical protein